MPREHHCDVAVAGMRDAGAAAVITAKEAGATAWRSSGRQRPTGAPGTHGTPIREFIDVEMAIKQADRGTRPGVGHPGVRQRATAVPD